MFAMTPASPTQGKMDARKELRLHRADEERIRTAYKKLARQWHPDKNPDANATEIFQKVNAAYHRLTQVRASVYVCVDTAIDA